MEKIHLYDKILTPLVTEKSTNLSVQNKVIFKVPNRTNKINLKKNIEKIFKVNVTKINIINKQPRKKTVRGKYKGHRSWLGIPIHADGEPVDPDDIDDEGKTISKDLEVFNRNMKEQIDTVMKMANVGKFMAMDVLERVTILGNLLSSNVSNMTNHEVEKYKKFLKSELEKIKEMDSKK